MGSKVVIKRKPEERIGEYMEIGEEEGQRRERWKGRGVKNWGDAVVPPNSGVRCPSAQRQSTLLTYHRIPASVGISPQVAAASDITRSHGSARMF